jgi:hypothetical protein
MCTYAHINMYRNIQICIFINKYLQIESLDMIFIKTIFPELVYDLMMIFTSIDDDCIGIKEDSLYLFMSALVLTYTFLFLASFLFYFIFLFFYLPYMLQFEYVLR